ncbi:hypothetical protein PMAYCL1PPCAC_08772, partial [Pristionchus mayeri]
GSTSQVESHVRARLLRAAVGCRRRRRGFTSDEGSHWQHALFVTGLVLVSALLLVAREILDGRPVVLQSLSCIPAADA